jgi:adenylate kinase family enzyme
MKRVAVFGNAGGGKSTLARKLAEITGLPLHIIDYMQFKEGGDPVPKEEFLASHAKLINEEKWIIDGYGSTALAWERFDKADTLVHVDLPVVTHYWWVTKRFIGGLFKDPPGWPKGSPLWSSTLQSYRVIRLCHKNLTPKYRAYVAGSSQQKQVHRLRSAREIAAFLDGAKKERAK